jgi:hypothetical protein
MADKFEEGNAVRLKEDNSTDPSDNMKIVARGRMSGIDSALCRYVRTTVDTGGIPTHEPIEEWFPLAELATC